MLPILVGGCRNDELWFNFTCFPFLGFIHGETGLGFSGLFFRRVLPGECCIHDSRFQRLGTTREYSRVVDVSEDNCHLAVGKSIYHSLQDKKTRDKNQPLPP